jgi:Protein of unknown function (DUF1569)
MATIWDEDTRRHLLERLTRLTPEAHGKWGKMTAPAMLAHLTDACRMALGELSAKSKNLPIRYWPIRELFVYVLPFPKNAPTAPELLTRTASDWPGEVTDLRAAIDRMVARASHEFPEHPAFGRMSAKAWGVLVYRHMDHHLRQFGV